MSSAPGGATTAAVDSDIDFGDGDEIVGVAANAQIVQHSNTGSEPNACWWRRRRNRTRARRRSWATIPRAPTPAITPKTATKMLDGGSGAIGVAASIPNKEPA